LSQKWGKEAGFSLFWKNSNKHLKINLLFFYQFLIKEGGRPVPPFEKYKISFTLKKQQV
jgi:hypothetical protein